MRAFKHVITKFPLNNLDVWKKVSISEFLLDRLHLNKNNKNIKKDEFFCFCIRFALSLQRICVTH